MFVFLLAWVFQDKPYAISTPRYLALAAASMVLTCRVYVVGRGERDLVMCMTWHLLGLNSIFHLISHTWRILGRPVIAQSQLIWLSLR